MSLIILVSITAVLFGVAFFSKRRFGILGLALCAGVLLAQSLSGELAVVIENIVEDYELSLQPFTPRVLAACLLTLLPSLVLLTAGPKYLPGKIAIIGAATYAVLGTLLLLGPLSSALTFEGFAQQALRFVSEYESTVIAIAVAAAVLDTFAIHGPRLGKKDKKH